MEDIAARISGRERPDPARVGDVASRVVAAVGPILMEATALAIGVFTIDGRVRFANAGMARLLREATARSLVCPTLAELAAGLGGEDDSYRGLLHFGEGPENARTVRGQARRLDGDVLVMAEPDVAELERVGDELSALNSELVNVQRRLVIEQHSRALALEELRQTQARLLRSEKLSAVGSFAASLLHEIGNPLAFVVSNVVTLGEAHQRLLAGYRALEQHVRDRGSEALQDDAAQVRREVELELDDDAAELVDSTMSGLRRISKILETLRSGPGVDRPRREAVNPNEILEATLTTAAPSLRRTGVEVSVDLGDLPRVSCVPAEIGQAFLNLVTNAAQALQECGGSRRGGRLVIRSRREDSGVAFDFEDDGPGMAPEISARIFEPFFTTKPAGQGTGLGLYVTHDIIVGRHGGAIAVRSAPGAGATFTVRLPVEVP